MTDRDVRGDDDRLETGPAAAGSGEEWDEDDWDENGDEEEWDEGEDEDDDWDDEEWDEGDDPDPRRSGRDDRD